MNNYPLASIPATQARRLRSAAIGQQYLISVATPFNYTEQPDLRYPVIYLLDANSYFGMVVEMVRTMNIRVRLLQ